MAKKKSKLSKAVRDSRELERIENLLGEDFESLAQARKALKQETRPSKSSYTVKELSSRKNKTVKAFINDIESHVDELDSLKTPVDRWGAEIYGYKTYSLYGSMSQLASDLSKYVARGLGEENPTKALNRIKIIRVGFKEEKKWVKTLEQQLATKRARRKEFTRKAQAKNRASQRKIEKLKRQVQKERKLRKAAERKLSSQKR